MHARTPPPSSDTESRTAIRRLIEVSMGVIVPAEELEKDPIPNAVALMSLSDAIEKKGKVCSWNAKRLLHFISIFHLTFDSFL